MGFVASLIAPERRETTLRDPARWLIDALTGGKVASGVAVNEYVALNYSAVYACVRAISETIATLPKPVYRRLDNGGKQRAPEHRAYAILHDAPNPYMTSVEFWETMVGHIETWGNAYAEIVRDGAGRVVALWPLRPDHMTIRVSPRDRSVSYQYTVPDGTLITLDSYRVLHLRGLSFDGIYGYSPVRLAREAIGLGLAAQEFGARFFGNDSRPGGVLEHPGKLSEAAHKRMKASWEEAHRSLENKYRIAILEEGTKWQQIGIPPEDAQFLQTRRFQLEEIARIYRVPPHVIGDLEKATFSNIEQQAIEFVTHCIRPRCVRLEQRVNQVLFSTEQQGTYFMEFLIDGLLRGDIQSRYAAYAVGRQWGWLSVDEIRELENMNPLPNGQGQKYLVPMNMSVLGQPAQAPKEV